ncbi:MAG: VCBS repeat-containing protein [Planctomycetales bacterium]|nr:VCBS repeat-containing protein [Planctomycetales bacterium]
MRRADAWAAATVLLAGGAAADEGGGAGDLRPPFRVEAAGKPIDVEIGHAAPLLADLDGDGVRDLLVGQFEGRLRLYRNEGTATAPRFGEPAYVKAGDTDARVPTG